MVVIKKINRFYRLRHSIDWIFPSLAFLLLVVMAYGPLVPFLGFYWDDWPVIYQIDVGADFWSFYAYDRPFSAWTYLLFAPMLGIRPLGWHLFGLLLRWLTTLGMWWNIRLLWPSHRRAALWVGLIFTLHPAFNLQPVAVAFSQHLITTVLFLISTGAMLLAARKPARSIPLIALALLTQAIHMLTMEYYWGLELLRPFLLFIIVAGNGAQRFWQAVKAWSPYLVVFLLLVSWRVFILEFPGGDPNAFELLDLIRQNPLEGLQEGISAVIQDSLHLILQVWAESLAFTEGATSLQFSLVTWAWAFLAGLLVYSSLRDLGVNQPGVSTDAAPRSAIWLGVLALLFALAPTWITGNQITRGMYGARFALPALFGASVLMAGLVTYLLRPGQPQRIVLAVLAGLAVGAHLKNANDFRWDRNEQADFYWQMSWRAPGLEPGTALISDGAIFLYEGGYPTSAALNTLYDQAQAYPQQSYWFFELDNTYWRDIETFIGGVGLEESLRNLIFTGHSRDSLAIYYQPESGSCLQVLAPDDQMLPILPELTAQGVLVSDLSRIRRQANLDRAALEAIFGIEPEPDWCYFYQKAGLALQFEDYGMVIELERQALETGLSPNNPLEWLPFIEARARNGEWQLAAVRTVEVFEESNLSVNRRYLCDFWSRISQDSGQPYPLGLDCE